MRWRWSHAPAFVTFLQVGRVSAAAFTCSGGWLSFVAHPDDDLLFQSPDILPYISNHNCLTTVFLTSGDAGLSLTYSESREAGNEAAYAYMAGVTDSWTELNATLAGHPVLIRTLNQMPQIQKVLFRLPDGGSGGHFEKGFYSNGYQSLLKLYSGAIPTLTNRYGVTWTLPELSRALQQIISARGASTVATLDYLSDYLSGDHPDHATTARLVASLSSPAGYMGYPSQLSRFVDLFTPTDLETTVASYPTNVGGAQLLAKEHAFFVYTPFDVAECSSMANCVATGRPEVDWLPRQYVVSGSLKTNTTDPTTTYGPGVPTGGTKVPACSPNLALLANAKASSTASGSAAAAAVDNIISGYPLNAAAEWASQTTAGPRLTLTWSQAQTFDTVVLYDRPNALDQVTAGSLIGDGSQTWSTGALRNDGSATVISLGSIVTSTTLTFTILACSWTTVQSGLSEIQVYLAGNAICASASASASSAAPAVSSQSPSSDIAMLAHASASSASPGQDASKAIDGVVSGYPNDWTKEWASNGEGVGAWLNLSWPQAYLVTLIMLFDRPNANDQVTSGIVKFSDGSSLAVDSLPNDGSAYALNIPPRTIHSLHFLVTSVSSSTQNVGLAEIMVFGALATSRSISGLFSATGTLVSSSIAAASDLSGFPVLPTSSLAASQLSFSSSNGLPSGSLSSSSAHLPLSSSQPMQVSDIALLATATASSSAPNQEAAKAIDGIINGYPVDYTKEWSSVGEGVGAWLRLAWPQSFVVTSIALYDRVNLNDQVLSATVSLSDGTTLRVGSLNNDGTATPLNFTAKIVHSLLFTINSVSSSTYNVGLAEIAVFGYPAYPSSSSLSLAPTLSGYTASLPVAASAPAVASVEPSSSFLSISGLLTQSLATSSASARAVASSALPQAVYYGDVALLADATASSQSDANQQAASNAVNGVVDGYPGDYTQEWATDGQQVGAWLLLSWKEPVFINSVTLCDRPNLNDQILGGTLTFADGSLVQVGTLFNDGSPTSINFTARTTSSLLLTVTSCSTSTWNVGLAEIMAYGTPVPSVSSSSHTMRTNTQIASRLGSPFLSASFDASSLPAERSSSTSSTVSSIYQTLSEFASGPSRGFSTLSPTSGTLTASRGLLSSTMNPSQHGAPQILNSATSSPSTSARTLSLAPQVKASTFSVTPDLSSVKPSSSSTSLSSLTPKFSSLLPLKPSILSRPQSPAIQPTSSALANARNSNYALSSGVTATASFQPEHASYVMDGQMTTFWSPSVAQGSWIEVDLPQAQLIASVTISLAATSDPIVKSTLILGDSQIIDLGRLSAQEPLKVSVESKTASLRLVVDQAPPNASVAIAEIEIYVSRGESRDAR